MPLYTVTLKPEVEPKGTFKSLGLPEGLSNVPRIVSVELTDTAASVLRRNPAVLAVESEIAAVEDALAQRTSYAAFLDRLDDPALPPSGSYFYSRDGAGVTFYVMDTSLPYLENPDLADSDIEVLGEFSTSSGSTHTTTMLGIALGSRYGIAPRMRGRTACVNNATTLTAGADAIIADHIAHGGPSVCAIPMTFNGGSTTVDTAVQTMLDAGIVVTTSAGNDGADTSNDSPNRLAGVLTVGGHEYNNSIWSTSNFGSVVDVFILNYHITPTLAVTPDPATASPDVWFPGWEYVTGTSGASCAAAAVCALILQEERTLTPAQVHQRIIDYSIPDVLTGLPVGTPNRMVQIPTVIRETGAIHSRVASTSITVTPSEPGNSPPTASFTVSPNPTSSPMTVLTLDGTASSDSDGTIASYQWELVSAPAGYTGTFSSPTASATLFTPVEDTSNDNTLPTHLPFTLG